LKERERERCRRGERESERARERTKERERGRERDREREREKERERERESESRRRTNVQTTQAEFNQSLSLYSHSTLSLTPPLFQIFQLYFRNRLIGLFLATPPPPLPPVRFLLLLQISIPLVRAKWFTF